MTMADFFLFLLQRPQRAGKNDEYDVCNRGWSPKSALASLKCFAKLYKLTHCRSLPLEKGNSCCRRRKCSSAYYGFTRSVTPRGEIPLTLCPGCLLVLLPYPVQYGIHSREACAGSCNATGSSIVAGSAPVFRIYGRPCHSASIDYMRYSTTS